MAEKAVKVEMKPIPSDREGLFSSMVTQTAELSEKLTTTCFGFVRDVRSEINQRVLGTLTFVESAQQGVFKLIRNFSDRTDKLAEDMIDTAENLTLGTVRAVRDTGHGVTGIATGIATNLTKSREVRAV